MKRSLTFTLVLVLILILSCFAIALSIEAEDAADGGGEGMSAEGHELPEAMDIGGESKKSIGGIAGDVGGYDDIPDTCIIGNVNVTAVRTLADGSNVDALVGRYRDGEGVGGEDGEYCQTVNIQMLLATHNLSAWIIDETGHYRECRGCDNDESCDYAEEKAEHSLTKATCLDSAVCTLCGWTDYRLVDHQWLSNGECAVCHIGGAYTPDYSKLEAAMEAATVLDKSDYTATEWEELMAALAIAEEACSSESQSEVDSAAAKLNTVVNAMKKKVVDYSELEATIAKAKALKEADYLISYWINLKSQIANAEASLESCEQAEVDYAAALLNVAICNMREKDVDHSKLETAIAKATALKEEDYTKESWAAVKTTLGLAEEARIATLQSVVNETVAELENAIASLVKLADTSGTLITDTDTALESDGHTDSNELTGEDGCTSAAAGAAVVLAVASALGAAVSFKKKEN